METKIKIAFLLLFALPVFVASTQAQATLRYFEFSNRCGHGEWRDTSFVAATSDPAVIALVENELQKPTTERFLMINGALAMGSNGYNKNANYEFPWHIVENGWVLTELSIELCDGCPYTDISQNLDYWVNTVKRYCGWRTKVRREVFPFSSCEPICITINVKTVKSKDG